MRAWILGAVLTCSGGMPVMASDNAAKFSVSGDRIIYDTETAVRNSEVEDDDVDTYLAVLQANSGVKVLVLNSSGGSVWAGTEMARITLDYGLDTMVAGECSSSCVNIFLAGATRTMQRGSKIGFHSRSWSPEAVQRYYDKWRSSEGWKTPFDFGSWIYVDTQAETYEDLVYITSRGVSAEFAIKMKAPREKTWFPHRSELLEAGILTE